MQSPKPLSKNVLDALDDDERKSLGALVEFRDRHNLEPVDAIISSGLDDFDDWQALAGVVTLERLGLIRTNLIIAGLQAAETRARAIKGFLNTMNLQVPVAVGTDRSPRDSSEIEILTDAGQRFLSSVETVHQDGIGALMLALQKTRKKSVLMGLASFSDFSDLAKHDREFFRERVGHVVLMSGLDQTDEETDEGLTNLRYFEDGSLKPNEIAINNQFDPYSTKSLFKVAQSLEAFTVLTRQAAYATYFRREVIDALGVIGYQDLPAKFAYDTAGRLLQKFWVDAIDGTGPRNYEWFIRVFFKGQDPFKGQRLTKNQLKLKPIIQHIERLVPYDLLSVLAGLDEQLVSTLFSPIEDVKEGCRRRIIGLSSAKNGLRKDSEIDLPPLIGALTKYPFLERLDRDGKL